MKNKLEKILNKMKQLDIGIKIEAEHTPTYNYIRQFEKKHGRLPSKREFFKKIAQNHIAEDKNYYKKLVGCKL